MRHVIFSLSVVLLGSHGLPHEAAVAGPAAGVPPSERPLVGGARALRTEVAGLMGKPGGPTTDDLLRATVLASAAVRLASDEPWGYAARCDIAVKWGDASMIENCLQDLRRVAPGHEETKRAAAALAALSPHVLGSRGRVMAWGVLGLVCLVTFAHAFSRRLRSRIRRTGRTAVALMVAGLMLGGLGSADAAGTSTQAPPAKFTIDDNDPEAGVPAIALQNQSPLEFAYYLQDMIERAATATGKRDHKAAIRYYRALAKAVPDRSTAWGKLCASYEAAGDPGKAILACRQAMGLPGVLAADYTRFVRLILAKEGALPPADIEDVKEVVKHLAKDKETLLAAHHLECELGLRLSDVGVLESCTKALAAVAPADARTISFQWALALKKGDNDTARRLIDRARTAGLAPDGLARMESATGAGSWFGGGRLGGWRTLLAVGLCGLAGVTTFVVVRRRRETRQIAA